ncbi:MAG: ADP-ribosylglycohydrolase family protein [Reichenbachiella sp.]
MRKLYYISKFIFIIIISISCSIESSKVDIPIPQKGLLETEVVVLDKPAYYDKVLGALVGSAIGDAMGASTEMWHRSRIQEEYGYINGLKFIKREKSAEGIWAHNLDSGATTDDTRWKYFMVKYFTEYGQKLSLNNYSAFIVNYYQENVKSISEPMTLNNPDLLDSKMQKVNWIKEWARIAIAYQEGGKRYEEVKNRFYGGEMSCAGMLYTPMFGLVTDTPVEAYRVAYEHALFDIGYAKDISSLVATMTQKAIYENDINLVLRNSFLVDPFNYQDSRLIGRISSSIYYDSNDIVNAALALPAGDTLQVNKPKKYADSSLEWMRQNYIYGELEKRQKSIPFHSGEIWQILCTSLIFGEGEFHKTMKFIVNYGRDNDTVAAVAGMILGAKMGFKNLPKSERDTVLKVNSEKLGIDFEVLAKELVDKYYLNIISN